MTTVNPPEEFVIETTVNGNTVRFQTEARVSLADVLRTELNLPGTHVGCETGVCGACTVLVDDAPMRSCLMLAVQAEGREIQTIEGLATGRELHPLQESFRRHHALQCGFCTPGFLATALALLREKPSPTRAEVRHAIGGNLCRCTGYQTIVDAICDETVAAWAREGRL